MSHKLLPTHPHILLRDLIRISGKFRALLCRKEHTLCNRTKFLHFLYSVWQVIQRQTQKIRQHPIYKIDIRYFIFDVYRVRFHMRLQPAHFSPKCKYYSSTLLIYIYMFKFDTYFPIYITNMSSRSWQKDHLKLNELKARH